MRRSYAHLGRHSWFPHLPLAVMVVLAGCWVLTVAFGPLWYQGIAGVVFGGRHVQFAKLPSLLIGGGAIAMGVALLWRSRLAWLMALLLAIAATLNALIGNHAHDVLLAAYFVLVFVLLAFAWRHFDRSSAAASTLFAIMSVSMLLLYATFGAYYLGAEFKPNITNLVEAAYFATVTMSTVGYGDIVPQTPEARLFTISVIVLGVAVFATSLTAVVAPLISKSLQRIVNHRGSRVKRENHFVVIGNTPLASNTARELGKRGFDVTRIMREAPDAGDKASADVVVGDPSMTDVLSEAGVAQASAVLAMLADDSDNAFVVLAVRELAPDVRTVAAVNDARHLSRVKLVQPTIVVAPQVLGGELTAMLLSGEHVTPDFVMQRVFQDSPQG